MSENKSSFHVEHDRNKSDVPRGTDKVFLENCPLCDSVQISPSLSCTDYTTTGETFLLDFCQECGFLFTNPQPLPEVLSKYYTSPEYISHSEIKTGLINKLYHAVQKRNLRYKFSICKRYAPSGKWIDYGSGAGAYLKYVSDHNQIIAGYEPDPNARKASKIKKQEVQSTNDYRTLDLNVACISMWHVLEHIPNFMEILSLHAENLLPNGILVIAVPNHRSYDAAFYKNKWAAYDVPRHLWHFTEKDMTKLAHKYRLALEHIRPLIFDSFYVSMLSEKNNNGNVVRGLFIGLVSNIKARFMKQPFSSQIYVFRKLPF